MRGRNGQYIKYKLLHAIITIIVHHLVPVFDRILIFIAPSVQIRDDNVSNATSTNILVKISVEKGDKSNKLLSDPHHNVSPGVGKLNWNHIPRKISVSDSLAPGFMKLKAYCEIWYSWEIIMIEESYIPAKAGLSVQTQLNGKGGKLSSWMNCSIFCFGNYKLLNCQGDIMTSSEGCSRKLLSLSLSILMSSSNNWCQKLKYNWRAFNNINGQ